jgi:formate hydrogenlyase transcriptional activator
MEKKHILNALEASNWVVGGSNGAAQRLGMKRTSLLYRMKKLRIRRTAMLRENLGGAAASGL